MSLDITIEQQPAMHALEIAGDAPMWKIPKLLGENFPRIDKHIDAQGGSRTGSPYVRYMEIDWQHMRHCGPLRMLWKMLTSTQPMRIGMTVEAPLDSDGDIEAISIEPQPCVRTIHRGPYQKIGDTYKEIVDWAEANNVELANHTMENYINDPTTVARYLRHSFELVADFLANDEESRASSQDPIGDVALTEAKQIRRRVLIAGGWKSLEAIDQTADHHFPLPHGSSVFWDVRGDTSAEAARRVEQALSASITPPPSPVLDAVLDPAGTGIGSARLDQD